MLHRYKIGLASEHCCACVMWGVGAPEEEEEEEEDEVDPNYVPPPPPLAVTSAEVVTEVSSEVDFVARRTIGNSAAAAPIVGQADSIETLKATAGMQFATVFETDDAAMTWTAELEFDAGSPEFLVQWALTENAVEDQTAGGSAVYRFMAAYEVVEDIEATDDLGATLTFAFSDGASFDYTYEFNFEYGAPDPAMVEINNIIPAGEDSSTPKRDFPWRYVLFGIIIAWIILYYGIL